MMAGIALTVAMLALVPLKPVWKPRLRALFEQGGGILSGECAPAEAVEI